MPVATTSSGGNRSISVSRSPLPLASLAQYNPNRPDATEALWQPYYDRQTYGTAGATSFSFFQTPNGQSGKTFADTNMLAAGQFPAPTAFLVTAIQVVLFPGALASITGTQGAVSTFWNDTVAVANAGYLEFVIGSKPYLRDAPIGKFAPNFTINGIAGAGVGNATAGVVSSTNFARAAGRYYEITPLLIPQNQNFSVTLYFPTAVAIGVTGSIECILDGFFYRQSQ